MAVLTNLNPTLLDVGRAMDPDGRIAAVIELLHQTNEMMADMTWLEGNLPTGHKSTVRTGLPTVSFRRLYQGVFSDKSQRATVTDTCGMIEHYDEIDVALADLNGNANSFRLSESMATIEAISQLEARSMIYGNIAEDPEQIEGLAPRYSDLSAPNADNIIDAGGTGTDNRSIWLVCWGPTSCFGVYPKASTGGLSVTNKGQVTSETVAANGGKMEVYRMHYKKMTGLCLPDWRYVVRIANIDRSALSADGTTGAILPNLMFEAMERLPSMASSMRCAFYMDRGVRTIWRQQLANLTKQSTLEYKDVGGHKAVMFNEMPVRRLDVLAADEARVV